MSLAVVYSRSLDALQAPQVNVEVHLANGLPSFTLVGLAETEVKESRERVRAALQNSGLTFPHNKRITVNLAPAELPKESGRFDLPIALGILAASGQIDAARLEQFEFAGELSLSGELRPVRGALALALGVRKMQVKRALILPLASAQEAALVDGVAVHAAAHLLDVVRWLVEPGDGSCVAIPQAALLRPEAVRVLPDRFFHMLLIGRTGVGKTTLIETMALQDMRNGHGLCVIDPHGDLYDRLYGEMPEKRRADLIALDLTQRDQAFGYNPLRRVAPHLIPLAAGGMLSAMKKMWETEWGVRMEHILRNALFALIEFGHATLPDVLRLITDDAFRKDVLRRVSNEQVRLFWEKEYPKYNPRYRQEAIAPIQNKIGAFLADPRMRRLFTEGKNELSLRRAMDDGKVLLVNLAKGKLGDDTAGLLGAFLVSTIALAAFSRADSAETDRADFFLYIDEFQSFTTPAVVDMISGLRKFRVSLALGHQHLSQLTPDVRHAVLANAGTLITFRVGPEDALLLAREFDGVFDPTDLLNLPNHDAYWKLMIDATPCRPFSGTALPPVALPRRE